MLLYSVILLLPLVNSLPTLYRGKLKYSERDNNNREINSPFDYYLDQELDHFNREDTTTFSQRYFLNTTYWKGADSNAPVFLCVGGEGPPLTYQVLIASDHCNDMTELAPKHGALMVALEHRYYGASIPNDDLSTDNLKWLNSEQALEDIAHFHSVIADQFGLTNKNKWVTWGGSYPGMMAGLARLRYPHLIHASVSSSSPLQAQVDMYEYNEVVAQSMAAEVVGGSKQCASAISEGHATIGDMLQTKEGREQLESMFNICVPGTLDDVKNQEQFAGDGVVYLPVQSNDPSCSTPYCNIASICELMADDTKGTPLERLVSLHTAQSGGVCTPISYDLMINGISNPKNPERSWLYQTCSEWGFYQTCPKGSQCPYTQGLHTLEVDYDICQQAFSVNATQVDNQIDAALARYGGSNIQSTRIMFPNGEIDPWHALGVLSSPNDREPTLYVTGASHHFWTHPSEPTDSVYVREARQQIWEQVDAWLEEDSSI